MKTFITFMRDSFGKSSSGDSVQEFFKSTPAEKRPLYEEALRAAQADQRKVIERAAAL